jgi:hypothetical protein
MAGRDIALNDSFEYMARDHLLGTIALYVQPYRAIDDLLYFGIDEDIEVNTDLVGTMMDVRDAVGVV